MFRHSKYKIKTLLRWGVFLIEYVYYTVKKTIEIFILPCYNSSSKQFKNVVLHHKEDIMIEFGKENKEIRTPPFLVSVTDVNSDVFQNTLKIVVALPLYGAKGEGIDTDDEAFREAVSVYPDNGNKYEVVFEDYIAFQSINEHYSGASDGKFSGRYFVIYEKSEFLNNILEKTIAKGYIELGAIGEPVHYGVYTESHIIDVVSHTKPIIVKI